MFYKLYKMAFENSVHFGKKSLEDGESSFHADTLFSALCQEALKLGGTEQLEELVGMAKDGIICFSDAFPYKGKEYYLPKPFIQIDSREKQGDSGLKKKYKTLKYVPLCFFNDFLSGDFPEEHLGDLDDLGYFAVRTTAAVRGREETEPFRIKKYYFNEGNGLYFLMGSEEEEPPFWIEELLESLSFSGIGGKRSSGAGRFQLFSGALPQELQKRLECRNGGRYMLLSVALPQKEELEDVMEGASYQIIRRSGFVASETYASEFMRKRDLYVFNSGSCFSQKFCGDVYDVSDGGKHSVYRYGKPFFLEVNYAK